MREDWLHLHAELAQGEDVEDHPPPDFSGRVALLVEDLHAAVVLLGLLMIQDGQPSSCNDQGRVFQALIKNLKAKLKADLHQIEFHAPDLDDAIAGSATEGDNFGFGRVDLHLDLDHLWQGQEGGLASSPC